MPRATDTAAMIAGFVAAEGCFQANGTQRKSFHFKVELGATDRMACEWMLEYFGVGHLYEYPRRQEHYDDEVRFQIRAMPDLVTRVVPFMDEHLPPSYKREQYLEWREELLEYWAHDAKRTRECHVIDCPNDRVGRGLCKKHYMAWHRRTAGGRLPDPSPPELKPGLELGLLKAPADAIDLREPEPSPVDG